MAERTPLHEASPMSWPLEWLTRQALRAPGLVFSAGVALGLIAVVVSICGLKFKTSRLDLLSPRSEYNKRWLAYLEEFGDRDDAVVVIRGGNAASVTKAIDDLGLQLRERPDLFESVIDRLEFSDLKAKGLHYLPASELHKLANLAAQASQMTPREGAEADPVEALRTCNEQWERIGFEAPEVREQMERSYSQITVRMLAAVAAMQQRNSRPLAENRPTNTLNGVQQATYEDLAAAAAGAGSGLSTTALAAMPQETERRLLAENGTMGFVLLKLKGEKAEFSRGSKAIGILRKEIDEARVRHPQAWIGLTGMPVIEFDEMQASQFDMTWTNVLSFIAVAALFVAGYGGWRHALLANIVLLLAIAYSFAFVTIFIGHLNILSSAFGAMLIGLGIDYGTYYIAYYLDLRQKGDTIDGALIRAMAEAGPGMVTGAVTTAAAFFMAGLTEFTGVRELGIIAGAGIVLCIAATIVILPPLVLLVDRRWPTASMPRLLPAAGWFKTSLRWPRLVFIGAAAVTLLLGSGMTGLRYDHNLLNLQPKHVESVDIERELFTNQENSVWFAVSMCPTREALRQRKAMFEQLPTVAKTEEIVTLLPESNREKQQAIVDIASAAAYLPAETPVLAPVRIAQLQNEIARALQLFATSQQPSRSAAMLAQLRFALSQMPEQQSGPEMAAVLTRLSQQSLIQLNQLRATADPIPPQLSDLPRELTDRYVGKSSKHLLKVYAKGNIWDMDRLKQFVAEIESVDGQITGHPVQTYYASKHMQQSFIQAGIYAFFAVLAILMFDFRSLRMSLLAMVPLCLGLVQTFGLLAWLDVPFNAANMISIALILGIGVDVGVHLTHEFRRQRGPFKLTDATTMAVLLTESTTMASFGAMIFARHQGLRSLGQVLTIGVTCCLASSIVAYPALLRWLTRHRKEEEDEVEESAEAESEAHGPLSPWERARVREGREQWAEPLAQPHTLAAAKLAQLAEADCPAPTTRRHPDPLPEGEGENGPLSPWERARVREGREQWAEPPPQPQAPPPTEAVAQAPHFAELTLFSDCPAPASGPHPDPLPVGEGEQDEFIPSFTTHWLEAAHTVPQPHVALQQPLAAAGDDKRLIPRRSVER